MFFQKKVPFYGIRKGGYLSVDAVLEVEEERTDDGVDHSVLIPKLHHNSG